MKKLWLLALVAAFLILAAAPPASNWKWRTHGGVYGSRGIAVVAHERIVSSTGVPDATKNGLEYQIIRPATIRPDTWYQEPYYIGGRHYMTYCRDEGASWLENAQDARTAPGGPYWENVSYYLGIASHYLGQVTQYTMHDNARAYYENLYPLDPDAAYEEWNERDDHLQWQIEYYRPQDPALIVQDSGDLYLTLADFINAFKPQINTFIYNVMPPDDPMGGWFGAWDNSRKCESSDYSEYTGNPGANVHYGAKELIDMATELVYSGWVYALDIEGSVSGDRITWAKWWSREHQKPGIVYIPF